VNFYTQSGWINWSRCEYPAIFLQIDNWDDFTYKISYNMYVKLSLEREDVQIGHVRILNSIDSNIKTPKYFKKLSVQFCSLGGNLDYYEKLRQLGKKHQEEILAALNDLAFNPELKIYFEDIDGYETAILREGNSTLINAKKYFFETNINNEEINTNNSNVSINNFSYEIKLPYANDKHLVHFDLSGMRDLNNRIHVIIGKNGTGKTQYLKFLAKDLEKKHIQGNFSEKPSFNRILTFSYSALNKFDYVEGESLNDSRSYHFNGYEAIEIHDVKEALKKSFNRINELGRDDFWIKSINSLLNKKIYIGKDATKVFDEINKYSSGQRIILEIITNLVANIRFNTVILYDEPEIHLHPNAMAKLIRVLNEVLNAFDSYCLIATHSPFLVRQLPKNNITIFDRIDDTPYIRKPHFETLSASLDVINSDIFNTRDEVDNYKMILKFLSDKYTYNEILEKLNDDLPIEGKIYLKTIIEGNYND